MSNAQAVVESVQRLKATADGLSEQETNSGHAATSSDLAALDERRRLIAAVEEGLADSEAGRTLSTDELKSSLENELGPIAWQ